MNSYVSSLHSIVNSIVLSVQVVLPYGTWDFDGKIGHYWQREKYVLSFSKQSFPSTGNYLHVHVYRAQCCILLI